MNKEELLKAIEQKRQAIWPTDTGEMTPATVPNNLEQGWLNALTWMEKFINSFPAEQPSEDLEEEFNDYFEKHLEICNDNTLRCGGEEFDTYDLLNVIEHFTQWQKQQMMKSAVDATCGLVATTDLFKVLICHEVTDKLTVGQKVKILIVKEDEQLKSKTNYAKRD